MTEETKRPKTALTSEELARWVETKAAGTHHVFRMRFVCPHCVETWYQDITDDPHDFASKPLPDRRNLGRAMLCGTCEALSRMVMGSVVPEVASEFIIPERDLFDSLGKLYTDHNMGWVACKGMGPYNGDPKSLIDQKRDQVKVIATRKEGNRVFRRAAYTVSEVYANEWRRFDEPQPQQARASAKPRLGR